MWGALCTLHLYLVSESCIWAAICTLYPVSRIRIPYLGLILYPVSRISYPYQVFGANSLLCLMFRVSFILLFGSALYLASSILYFESGGLGRIPYPVSCIRIPYRRDINVIFSVSFILLLGSALYLALSILNFEKCGLDRIPRIHSQMQNRVQIQDSNARYRIQNGTQTIQMRDTDTEYGIRSLPHPLRCSRYGIQIQKTGCKVGPTPTST